MESRVAAKNGENFRAEKRNKHARILTMRQVRQVPSLKNGWDFVDRLDKNVYKLCMLSKYSR